LALFDVGWLHPLEMYLLRHTNRRNYRSNLFCLNYTNILLSVFNKKIIYKGYKCPRHTSKRFGWAEGFGALASTHLHPQDPWGNSRVITCVELENNYRASLWWIKLTRHCYLGAVYYFLPRSSFINEYYVFTLFFRLIHPVLPSFQKTLEFALHIGLEHVLGRHHALKAGLGYL
jgi:hypothetical protein